MSDEEDTSGIALERGGARLGAHLLTDLAEAHGTPFYLYDLDGVRDRVAAVRGALSDLPLSLLYAVKANPSVALLSALRGVVDGLDVASTGEIALARAAGWSRAALHFAGPGKTAAALDEALETGGGIISLESPRELELVAAAARARGISARVALRLNPARKIHAFAVPMVGGPSPFGIDVEALPPVLERLAHHGGALALEGIHVHAGGQCTSAEGFAAHVQDTLALALRLEREHGVASSAVNFGGGLGVVSSGRRALALDRLGARFRALYAELGPRFARAPTPRLELGRYLVASAGIYVARVVSTKVSRGRTFVVLDGGLNHHLAATGLLSPRAPRLPLVNLTRPEAPTTRSTVVGPLCTPLDALGDEVDLPEPEVGDLVGVLGSGAYGFSLSPLLFLGHSTPVELVHEDGVVRCARARRGPLDFL